jgi:spore coat polysaccharide biosynthesis protein SpsF (cytidylyltransferase family)
MKIGIVIQARTDSTRLSRKVLLPLYKDEKMINYVIRRVQLTKKADAVILATTREKKDDELAASVKGIEVFRGDEDDVLDRYYNCAKEHGLDVIARVTGDCPLIDYRIVDRVIEKYLELDDDMAFVANILTETFPDGMDVDLFSFKALEYAWKNAKKKSEREHIRPFFKGNSRFRQVEVKSERFLGNYRLTVDEEEDFRLVKMIVEHFGDRLD